MSWSDDMSRDQEQHPERWGMKLDEMGNPVAADREWSGTMLTGLKDVEGTFTGLFDAMPPEWVGGDIQTLYLYGPDPDTSRARHWFYRIREWLFEGSRWFPEFPYPTVVLASGPAHLSVETEEPVPGVLLVSGSFRASGVWTLDPSLEDPDAEGESR